MHVDWPVTISILGKPNQTLPNIENGDPVSTAAAPRPRRLPVPAAEPPFDGRWPAAGVHVVAQPAVQGTLALSFPLPSGAPARPRPHLRLVQPPEPSPSEPPHVEAWAATLALAIAEVLNGDRPVPQLLHWTSATVFAQLSRRAALAAAQAPPVRDPLHRPTLRHVRVGRPATGVAEVSTVIHQPARARPLALRLEARRGRWLCTVLEVG